LRRRVEDKPMLGRRVVVYGGGNTAIDVARTAKRLGAQEAIIVYRRSREKMPAHDFEVEEALQDGHDVAFVQFDVKEAFPESDKVLFHPQEIMDRVDIFDHFVKERIKTNLELIQDQTIYAQVMNSFVGQFYTATVQSNRTALREWISRWPLLPH